MSAHKIFYTVPEIASDLSISESEAAELVLQLQKVLKASGKIVLSGKVPAAWYEIHKSDGFMKLGQQYRWVPLTEKRLLSVKEFCQYAGDIDGRLARKFARDNGLIVHIGSKMLIDRQRFDEWCVIQAEKK